MFEVEGLQATYDTPQGLGTRLSFPLGLGSSGGHCARLFTYRLISHRSSESYFTGGEMEA